jgi:RHS repeat-associated protein
MKIYILLLATFCLGYLYFAEPQLHMNAVERIVLNSPGKVLPAQAQEDVWGLSPDNVAYKAAELVSKFTEEMKRPIPRLEKIEAVVTQLKVDSAKWDTPLIPAGVEKYIEIGERVLTEGVAAYSGETEKSFSVEVGNSAPSSVRSVASVEIPHRLLNEVRFATSKRNSGESDSKISFSKSNSQPLNDTCLSPSTGDMNVGMGLTSDKLGEVGSYSSELTSKYTELNEILSFYRNEVSVVHTFGLVQSSEEILWNQKGTVLDIVNSASAVLRSIGHSVYMKTGEIRIREQDARSFFGTTSVSATLNAAVRAYLDYYKWKGRGLTSYESGELYVRIPYAWLYVHVNGVWQNIDVVGLDQFSEATSFEEFMPGHLDSDAYSSYFFEPDRAGRVKKPGTVLTKFFDQIEGLESKTQEISTGLVVGNSGLYPSSSTKYCEDTIETGLEDSDFSYESFVQVKTGGSEFSKSYDLALFGKDESFLFHDAGLIDEVGEGLSGQVVLSSQTEDYYFPITVSNNVDIEVRHGFALRALIDYSEFKYFPYQAGTVHAINHHVVPASLEIVREFQDELLENLGELSRLEKLKAYLKLTGLLFSNKAGKATNDLGVLRGVGRRAGMISTTYSRVGRIVDELSSSYGSVPLGIAINAQSRGIFYSRFLDSFVDGNSDSNARSAVDDFIIAASHFESEIFEELFGLPGFSATRILQGSSQINKNIEDVGGTSYFSFNKGIRIQTEDDKACLISKTAACDQDLVELVDDETRISIVSTIDSHFQKADEKGYEPGLILYSADRDYDSTVDVGGSSTEWSGIGFFYSTDQGEVGALFKVIDSSGLTFGGENPEEQETPLPLPADFDNNGGLAGDLAGGFGTCPTPNPVNLATGAMYHEWADFSLSGLNRDSRLKFTRKYMTESPMSFGDLPSGWMHNWDTRLLSSSRTELNNDQLEDVLWISESGGEILFKRNQEDSSLFDVGDGVYLSLVELTNEYELTRKGNIKLYFEKTDELTRGRLNRIVEPNGVEITAGYDEFGNLVSVSEPKAGALNFIRNSDTGRLEAVLSTLSGNEVSFLIEDRNGIEQLYESVDVDGDSTFYGYVQNSPGDEVIAGLMNSFTEPEGRRVQFEYYKNRKVFKEITPEGGEQSYSYAPYENLMYTLIRNADGTTSKVNFDNKYRIFQIEHEDGSRTQRVYNDNNEIIASIDALGFKTEYTYDARGNMTGVKRPTDSGFRTTTYDQVFDKVTLVDSLIDSNISMDIDASSGNVTKISQVVGGIEEFESYTYDSFGNLLSTTTNLGTYTNIRDSQGRLVSKFDSRNPETLLYDNRNRVVERREASGRIFTYSYDEEDRIIQTNDSHGPDTVNIYDRAGRLVATKVIAGGESQISRFNYDKRDRLVSSIDALGGTMNYQYDVKNIGCRITPKPVKTIDMIGRTSRYEYDALYRKTKEITPQGRITSYEYNTRGDLIKITDPGGVTTKFKYDGSRRMIERIRESSKSVSYSKVNTVDFITRWSYDDEDRLLEERKLTIPQPGPVHVVSYEYDESGRLLNRKQFIEDGGLAEKVYEDVDFSYLPLFGKSLMTKAQGLEVENSWQYESLPPYSQVSSSVVPTDDLNPLKLVSSSLTLNPSIFGKPQSVVSPTGELLRGVRYLPNGLMSSIVSEVAGDDYLESFSHDGFNRLVSQVSPTSTKQMGYDNLNRMTSINYLSSSYLEDVLLTYNSASEIIDRSIRNKNQALRSYSLSYDLDSQLNALDGPFDRLYFYDPSGNTIFFDGVQHKFSNNVLEKANSQFIQPEFIGLGRIEQKGAIKFEYRPDGRLVKSTNVQSGQTTRYIYDGLNRRIAKLDVSILNDDFVIGGYGFTHYGMRDQILETYDLSNPADRINLQVFGDRTDQHLAYVDPVSGEFKSYEADYLGSVMNFRGITNTYDSPFGWETYSSSPVPSYGFTGREYDHESSTYYYRTRQYDWRTGRFNQPDSIGILSGDTNLYRYAENNPISGVDRFGLKVDYGSNIVTNPRVRANVEQLNTNLINRGYPDDSFTIRITGGDRHMSTDGMASLSNSEIVTNYNKSPHLLESGARAVDFNIDGAVKKDDIKKAIDGTEFLPENTIGPEKYPDAPHYHVALPNNEKYYGPHSNVDEYMNSVNGGSSTVEGIIPCP